MSRSWHGGRLWFMRAALGTAVLCLLSASGACGGSSSSGAHGNGGGASSGSSSGSGLDSSIAPDSADDIDSSSSGGSGGSGGSGSPGSSSGTDGAGGSSSGDAAAESGVKAGVACPFASGLNVPWVNFASDVPNPDITTFTTIFQNTYAAGGRVVRWWFHTNGTVTPGYMSNGMVQSIPQSHIDGVTSILDAAHAAGVAINISLWSFDMLQGGEGITAALRTQNQNLLTEDAIRTSYVQNYLTPLVTAIKGHPGLYSYEIFNEPEGMTPSGWTQGNGGSEVPESAIQKTVNWLAAAIHSADPSALVTNGSQEFQYCSTVNGNTNDYSDSALRAAGGMENGILDFYEVHYYTSNGTQNSCFLHPASYWGLDKIVVMGEFFAATTDGVSQDDTYTYLYSNGYSGAWAWSYESDQTWPSMKVPMQNLYAADPSVGACPVTPATVTSAKVTSLGPAVPAGSSALVSATVDDDAARRASVLIHALADQGRSAEARGAAEVIVNRAPDSPWVREVERFTGAHRHRSLRVNGEGRIESY